MHKHVEKRILSEDSGFLYFVAQENDTPIGFVNLMVDEQNIGNITIISGESDSVTKELFEYSMSYFKNTNISRVELEIFPNEKYLESLINNLNGEAILKRYKINAK